MEIVDDDLPEDVEVFTFSLELIDNEDAEIVTLDPNLAQLIVDDDDEEVGKRIKCDVIAMYDLATCTITLSNMCVVPILLELMMMFDMDTYRVTEGRESPLVVTVLLNRPVDDVIDDILIVTDRGTATCK